MPYPPTDGGKQGSFNMLERLQHHMDMVLVFPVVRKSQLNNMAQLTKHLEKVRIYPFKYYNNKGSWKSQYFLFRLHRMITKKILKQPFLATPVYQEEYIKFVLDVIKKEKIDCVQNEYVEQLYLTYSLPANLKCIFVEHEIQYINKLRNIQGRVSVTEEVKYLACKAKQDEIQALNQYDAIITMTETDKQILAKDGVKRPIYPSPSFIPLPPASSFVPATNNKLTFIGGAGHYPNLNGMTWFLEEVWPLLLAKCPAMELNIIGNWNDGTRKKVTDNYKGVTCLGFVPNLHEAISGSIMVIPILIGSGIRMKILEAVNYYVPFVATSVGAEGLDFQSGTDCFIADNPDEMATCILKLNGSTNLQAQFAESAHKILVEKYSPKASSLRRLRIYQTIKNN